MITSAFVALTIPLALLQAYVITKLWGWFVMTTFTSAPKLTLVAAWGISLLVNLVTNEHPDHEKDWWWVTPLLAPVVVLLTGWILHSYFM